MTTKYVIELGDDVQFVTKVGVTASGNAYSLGEYKADLEELTSDYINEHYGSLQDDAYQRGLDDAWEAARKIVHMPEGDLLNIFTECYSAVCTALQVLLKYDASEAIEKLKAYEEKQKADDEIKVGDEVYCKGDDISDSGVVTWVGKESIYAMWQDGSAGEVQKDELVKTGRHFDIAKILEEMRND